MVSKVRISEHESVNARGKICRNLKNLKLYKLNERTKGDIPGYTPIHKQAYNWVNQTIKMSGGTRLQ